MAMRQRSCSYCVFAMVGTLFCIGCETLHNAGVPGLEQYAKKDPEAVRRENAQRENYVLHHDSKAFAWLIENQISNGMRLREVEAAIGEPGEYTTDFSRMASDGLYQTTDDVYRWGPDNSGRSLILFFRDGRVVNFDPKASKNL